MKRKVIILLLGCYILGVIQSCDLHYCKDVDYYDFSSVSIIEQDSVVEIDDSLNLRIQASNLDWMAQNQFNFSIIPNSYALACDQGWAGMKSPLTKIEITGDSDFNEDYLAHSLLNDLVTIDLCIADDYFDCDRKYLKLNEVALKKFMNPQNQYMANIFIVERPTKTKELKLTIKLFKSNGDIIIAESNSIIWK